MSRASRWGGALLLGGIVTALVIWPPGTLQRLLSAGPTDSSPSPTTQPGDPAGSAGPGGQPAAHRTLFAAPCENVTGQAQYDDVAAGLGDLTAVLLSRQDQITVVERQRLAALSTEQSHGLLGLTGERYAAQAGRLLAADTVLTGRLFLNGGKLIVSMQAIDVASERVVAAAQAPCAPEDLVGAALAVARRLGEQMALPLPPIDPKQIESAPSAALAFAQGLSRYHAGAMEEAIAHLMETEDLDPDFVEVHYWMGLAFARLGQDDHAIIEWDKFLHRQPDGGMAGKVKKLLAEATERQKNAPIPRLGPSPASQPDRGSDGIE
ncbi:MAG: hypothetical protein BIFFINMI_02800 [Phycisphaerae bacterium]|nr:hypothetical protein [Phycisphaerae bacterium]